jgi:hypothetical protein
VVPATYDTKKRMDNGETVSLAKMFPLLMGQACGPIHSVESALDIVENMVKDAANIMQGNAALIISRL